MEALLSILIGTVIFFYLFGIIGRFLLKYFINKKFRQFNGGNGGAWGNFSGQYQQNSQNRSHSNDSNYKEGEVYISQNNTSEKKVREKVGEYVDFEEVK